MALTFICKCVKISSFQSRTKTTQNLRELLKFGGFDSNWFIKGIPITCWWIPSFIYLRISYLIYRQLKFSALHISLLHMLDLWFSEASDKLSIYWKFQLSTSKTGESPPLSIFVFPILHPLFASKNTCTLSGYFAFIQTSHMKVGQ